MSEIANKQKDQLLQIRRRAFIIFCGLGIVSLPIALRLFRKGMLGRRQYAYEFGGPFDQAWTKNATDIVDSPVSDVRFSVAPESSKVECGFKFSGNAPVGSHIQPEIALHLATGYTKRILTTPVTNSPPTGNVHVKGIAVPRPRHPYLTVSRKFTWPAPHFLIQMV